MEIGLGGLIVWATKKWGIRESYVMMTIGALGVFVCLIMVWISGKIITPSTLIQVVLGTVVLCAWSLIIYKAKKQAQGMAFGSRSRKTLNQKAHEDEITNAVHGRLNKSRYAAFARTIFGTNGYFLEYGDSKRDSKGDYLDALLLREIAEPAIPQDFGYHMKEISKSIIERDHIFRNVYVVLLVYRILTIPEQASLTNQFAEIGESYAISNKISFEWWDKGKLDKYVAT